MNITLPIEFYGPGATPDIIAKLKNDIEMVWNGHFGNFNVTVNVIATKMLESVDPKTPPIGTNRIRLISPSIPQVENNRSHSSDVAQEETATSLNYTGHWNMGFWYTQYAGRPHIVDGKLWSNPSPGPHEAGHLMGLKRDFGDRYIEGTFEPKPGWRGDVMAGRGGVHVDPRNIQLIIENVIPC